MKKSNNHSADCDAVDSSRSIVGICGSRAGRADRVYRHQYAHNTYTVADCDSKPIHSPSDKPTTSPKPVVPKTGDESNLPLLAVVCGSSLLAGLGTYVYIRRKKDGEADD